MKKIGFVGLGTLGARLANNLLEAGHELTVYNRTPAKADDLINKGGQRVTRPQDTVTCSDVVFSILWDDDTVLDVVGSDHFLDAFGNQGIHVSMTTISPKVSQVLAERHAKRGIGFVEAPIFGRPEAATARKLVMPVAGPKGAKEVVMPLFRDMGASELFDQGENIGTATATKLIGNFMISSASRTMLEAARIAQAMGIEPAPIIDMLTHSLFAAPIFQAYGKIVVAGAASSAQSPIILKDLNLLTKSAQELTETPIANLLLALARETQGV